MSRVLTTLGARVVVLSGVVDQAYRWFDRLRSELVSSLASDEVLDRFNEFAYGGAPRYRPESGHFREYLFPFEEHALDQFFPPPAARVLIGGAGGGREAFALARRGYRVVAFEPAQALVDQLARGSGDLPIEVHRGAYGDLEQLFPPAEETFDAAILGWVSFSHLRSERDRLDALHHFARLTSGPVLVSFLALKSEPTQRLARFRRLLPRLTDRDPQDVFAMTVGFYHPVDEDEVRDLAGRAGMRVLHLNFDTRETSWPHAVLQRDG
jgi:SAM-dependent methyltransferase